MAGWTCFDNELIEWNGSIQVRKSVFIDGQLGIGTTKPEAILHIAGAEARLQNDTAFISFYNTAGTTRSGYMQFNSGAATEIATNINQPLILITNNSERVRVLTDGRVRIGTYSDTGGNNSIYITGGGATPVIGLSFGISDTIYGFRTESAGSILISPINGGADRMSLNTYGSTNQLVLESGGNIGIGKVLPAQKLHVAGALAFSNMAEPTLGACSGALFISGANLYYKGNAGTVTKLADA